MTWSRDEKMKSLLRERFQAFLVLWGIYLALISVFVIFSVFFLAPVFTYIRIGEVVILPDAAFGIKLVKATVYSSFVLALLMVIYNELTGRRGQQ